MKTIVVGRGLLGCAAVLMFQPEYWIVDEVNDISLDTPFPLGPQFLHKTPETELFLSELNIEPAETQIRWNWIKAGKLVYSPSEEDFQVYAEKSQKVTDITMKTSFKSLRRLKPLFKELLFLVKRYLEHGRTRVIQKEIKLETLRDFQTTENWIISTVPLGFQKIKTKETWFQLWATSQQQIKLLKHRDYICLLDKDSPIYRITRIGVGQLIVTEALCEVELNVPEYVEIAQLKTTTDVFNSQIPRHTSKMFFIGPFASNKPVYEFHDALKDFQYIRSAMSFERIK